MRTNSRLRTRFGLWIRLLVASAIVVVTLLVVIAAEFLIIGLLAGVGYAVVMWASFVFLSGHPIALLVGTGCYLGALVLGGHAARVANAEDHGFDPTEIAVELGQSLESIQRRAGRQPSILGALSVLALLGGTLWLAWTASELYLVVVPVVLSLFVTGRHLTRTVRAELSGDVAVLRTLDESVALSDDTDRDPELKDVRQRVDRLAQQVGVPAPEVTVAITRTPTAMTVGYRPAESTIVVSRGLLEDLDDRELEAVLAHELAHVANRDAAVMSAMSVAPAKAESFFERFDGGGPMLGLLILLLQALSRWCLIVVARYREYVADDGAVAITGEPAALASALETLDRSVARRPATDLRRHGAAAAFSIVPPPWEEHRFFDRTRWVLERRLFGTHPPTEKRIERLRSQIGDGDATGRQ